MYRLPTPEPDVIERVYVTVPQRDLINLLIERPSTPQPQIQERTVVAPAPRPLISHQVVTVLPRQQYNNNLRGVAYQYQPQVNYNLESASVVPYQGGAALSGLPQYYTQSSSYFYQPTQQGWGASQLWQQPQQQAAWGQQAGWGQQQAWGAQPQQQQSYWPQYQQQAAWGQQQQAYNPWQQQQQSNVWQQGGAYAGYPGY